MPRIYAFVIMVVALVVPGATSLAVLDAGRAVRVTVDVSTDTVTVGQRFEVTYGLAFADTLALVEPTEFNPGTCRVIDVSWEHARGTAARVRFIPVSIDSVHVPPQAFLFVTAQGDTLRAWSDPVDLTLRHLSAESQDLRPLKEQWTMPPNWLLWIALAAGALALAAALVWWIRRRRARRPLETAPVVRIPPDIVALTELERIEAMGLPARGEFKAFYTLITDAVRRYLAARFGVEALDRTTHELLDDLARGGHRIDGLGALLEEADLVKFAKYRPDVAHADDAMQRARDVVVANTRRAAVGGTPGHA